MKKCSSFTITTHLKEDLPLYHLFERFLIKNKGATSNSETAPLLLESTTN